MTMALTPDDLLNIASKVREIAGLKIRVETFVVDQHRVMLRWEGPDEPVVVGITEGEWSGKSSGNPSIGDTLREKTAGMNRTAIQIQRGR